MAASAPNPARQRIGGIPTPRLTLFGHAGDVFAVAAAPAIHVAEETIVTGGSDGSIRLWSSETGALLHTLRGHKDVVRALCLLSDGGTLLAGGDDAVLRVFDLGRVGDASAVDSPRALHGHAWAIRAVTQVDEALFASSGIESAVRVWDMLASTPLAKLTGHGQSVFGLAAVSPQLLATGSLDGFIKLWDMRTFTCVATMGTPAPVCSLVRLADGRVATGHDWSDGCVRLWDCVAGVCTAVLRGHDGSVNGLCQLADGTLVSTSYDGWVRTWDVSEVAPRSLGAWNAGAPLWGCAAVLSASGGVATGSNDSCVHLLDFAWHRRRVAVVRWLVARC